jgi:hypothetical protein
MMYSVKVLMPRKDYPCGETVFKCHYCYVSATDTQGGKDYLRDHVKREHYYTRGNKYTGFVHGQTILEFLANSYKMNKSVNSFLHALLDNRSNPTDNIMLEYCNINDCIYLCILCTAKMDSLESTRDHLFNAHVEVVFVK